MGIFNQLQGLVESVFNIFNLVPIQFYGLFAIAILIFVVRLLVGLL